MENRVFLDLTYSDLPNLMIAGDFNYVERSIDDVNANGPVKPQRTNPKAKAFLHSGLLLDTYREDNPNEVVTTHYHKSTGTFRRLDRWYVPPQIHSDSTSPDIIAAPDNISDHYAVPIRYGAKPESLL